MKISIVANYINGGWSPIDTDRPGASEKIIVTLAEALAKKHDVTCYINGYEGKVNYVNYKEHAKIDLEDSDRIVIFKAKGILNNPIDAPAIYITTAIEGFLARELEKVNKVVCISPFHLESMPNYGDPKLTYRMLWREFDKKYKTTQKKENCGIYCSSPDRGLKTLLDNKDKVLNKIDKLYITYGFEAADKIRTKTDNYDTWKQPLWELIESTEKIEYLGNVEHNELHKIMSKSKYWFLPLNHASSELFCVNAVNAQALDCIPVINKIGALNNTVKNHINFYDFLDGKTDLESEKLIENKKFSEQFDKEIILPKWIKLIENAD